MRYMPQPSSVSSMDNDLDDNFKEAVEIVTQYDRVSASLLQRRLLIGYARAARLLDQLENAGVLGPAEGSKPREVLIHSPEKILEGVPDKEVPKEDPKEEDLLEKAVKVVLQYDRSSASLLQRRLAIGYARAARIIDELEEVGAVGPAIGSDPREVLIHSYDDFVAK
jgi:DNA segregation ATPase FtsK/SpoIIIE-like protein